MGVMIAGLAVGIAGGVMGGMQQASQAKAQYLANKIEVERGNWQGQMANDRKTEAMARANANRRLQNEGLSKAAWTNRFLQTRDLQEMSRDAYANANAQARSAEAMLESTYTGKIGNVRGGTAGLLKTQAKAAERRKLMQLANEKRRMEENIATQYQNTLNARDMLTNHQASIFIPGSTGIQPSSAGPITQGILGGISSGLALGSGLDTFATKVGGPSGALGGGTMGPPERGA